MALDWTATSDDYLRAITAAITSDEVDGVLVIHAPPIHDAVGGPVDAIHERRVGVDTFAHESGQRDRRGSGH